MSRAGLSCGDGRRREECANWRYRRCEPLDLDQRARAARSLAELRRSVVAREHVGVAMYANRIVVRTERVVPRTARKAQHPEGYRVRHHSTGETSAATIIDAHHIAIGDVTPHCIHWIDRDRFTSGDLALRA